MEDKMRYQKVERVVEELRKRGFDLTTKEFFGMTVYRILRKFGIHEQLDLDEYFELLRRLMDICAENDMKQMGISYFEADELKEK